MIGGQTPGHTTTGRSCMKEAGRGSEQRLWMQSGKRSTRSGPRGPARNYQSGSERGLARRLEMLPLLRRKRRRSKSNPRSAVCISFTFQKQTRNTRNYKKNKNQNKEEIKMIS